MAELSSLPPGRWMVAWNSCHGDNTRWPTGVAVGPWPDKTNWSQRYLSTSGCCYSTFKDLSRRDKEIALLGLAFQIAANGIPPRDVLREFARIPEWRDMGVLLPDGRYERAFLPDPDRIDWSPHNQ